MALSSHALERSEASGKGLVLRAIQWEARFGARGDGVPLLCLRPCALEASEASRSATKLVLRPIQCVATAVNSLAAPGRAFPLPFP